MDAYAQAQRDFAMHGMRVFRGMLLKAGAALPEGMDTPLTLSQIVRIIDETFQSVGLDPE